MTRRPDPDRAFRSALLPLPCPDHARWRTVPHKGCLADGYWEIATDGHRLHARRTAPPDFEAEPDKDAELIRAAVELSAPAGRTERTLDLDAAALQRAHGLDAALGKRWNAAVDLATGAVHGYHAGDRDPTERDTAKRAAVLGGPVLAGVLPPEPGAPACYVRYLLEAVAFTETLTVLYEPDAPCAPLRMVSDDGARWALVLPCRV
ncbi:MAG: hypothetical protein M0R37_15535 [Bacteroidales bacterium]|nr:hypothetical protein [Bacteroidales bacterium]